MVAAAVISAAVGGVVANRAATKAQNAANNATAAQADAASDSTELGRERLRFEREQYEEGKPTREALSDRALEVSEAQLDSMRQNDALAADYSEYNRNTFRPLEQGIVADAYSFDTPDKRQAAADAAMGDVNLAFSRSNQANARSLAANGVDPGSARAMAAMQGQGVDQAVATAGAAYHARQGIETLGHARRMDAASLGRNLPSNQATSAQIAMQAGNHSVNNAGVPVQTQQSAGAGMRSGYDAATRAAGQAGNLYGNAADRYGKVANAYAQSAGNMMDMAGGMIGYKWGSVLSDR